MTTIPVIRTGVDWDGDGLICYNAVPGDALNLMPSPTTFHLLDSRPINGGLEGAEIVRIPSANFVDGIGTQALKLDIGTDVDEGVAIGEDTTPTADDIPVDISTEYTLSLYIRRASASDTLPVFVRVVNQAGATLATSGSTLLTQAWQKVSVTFTTGGSDTFIAIRIFKDNDATSDTCYVTGIMLVEGDETPEFNAGTTASLYENITLFTMMFDTKSGYNDWTDIIMSEGVANIRLDNTSRAFSPEYEDGALFDLFVNRRRVEICIQHPVSSDYIPMWKGWTEDIDVNPKRYGDGAANLKCSQGRFQLDKVPFRTVVSGTYTADEIINQVLEESFASAVNPYQSIFNQSTFANSFFEDGSELYDIDVGITELSVSGEDWGANVRATKVIEDLLHIERGWFVIARDGVVKFFNRRAHSGAGAPATISFSLNTEANDGSYSYGEGFINKVRVNYNPRDTHSALVWDTRDDPINVSALGSKEVTAKLEYQEGKKLTVSSVNETTDPDPTVIAVTRTDGTTAVTTKFEVEWVVVNGEVKITVTNSNSFPILVNIELWGTVVESFSGRIVEAFLTEDEDDFGDGIIEISDQSKLIVDDETATDYADFLLGTFGRRDGIFTDVSIKTRNATWLERQLDVEIGCIINVVEYQTAHDEEYIVVGENLKYTPGILTSTYILAPQEKLDLHFIVGLSELDNNAYYGY